MHASGNLYDLALILEFACEHGNYELRQCCVDRLNGIDQMEGEREMCADILVTLCTHNLTEHAWKVLQTVAALSTSHLRELQAKVADGILLEAFALKAEQLEMKVRKCDCRLQSRNAASGASGRGVGAYGDMDDGCGRSRGRGQASSASRSGSGIRAPGSFDLDCWD